MKVLEARSVVYISLILVVLMLTGVSYAQLNPVGIWLLDEDSGTTAYDSSNEGNDGTFENGPTWVSGRFGKALKFDGKDDNVSVPYDPSIALGDLDYTLTAWIYSEGPNNANNWRGIISHLNTYPAGYCLRLGETATPGSNKVFFFYGDVDSWEEFVSDTTLNEDEWYHVAVTYTADSNTVQIYVNGKAEGSRASGNEGDMVADDDAVLKIGEDWPPDGTRYFNGIIDEVGIFQSALTENDINDIMTKGFSNIFAVFPSGKLTITWGWIKKMS